MAKLKLVSGTALARAEGVSTEAIRKAASRGQLRRVDVRGHRHAPLIFTEAEARRWSLKRRRRKASAVRTGTGDAA